MNLKKEIKNLKGQTFTMSFWTQSDVDEVKEKTKVEAVTTDMLPRETIGNMLINCLSRYSPPEAEKKDVFEIMRLANWVNDESAEKPEIDEKLKNLLVKKVLPYSTIIDKPAEEGKPQQKQKGTYAYWAIAQIYQELGVTE